MTGKKHTKSKIEICLRMLNMVQRYNINPNVELFYIKNSLMALN